MKRRRKDSGFALLLVFLMAAAIAISLYMEIPRVAFETQRQKEQLLVDRGEQYKRAIQVFFATNKRWPARIEELESLNNRRFLRRRYVDPMTGKDEWRQIHVQNGVLTDSKVTKPQGQGQGEKKEQSAAAGFITEQTYVGGAQMQAQSGVNLANRRRQSDGGTAGGTGIPGQPGMMPGSPNMAGMSSGNPSQQFPNTPGMPPQPGQPVIGGVPGGVPTGIPGQGGMPTGIQGATGVPTGIPGQNGMPLPPNLQGQQPGMGGQQTPGNRTGQPTQSASSSGGGYVGVSGPYIGGSASPAQAAGNPGTPVNSQTGGVSPYPTTAGANGAAPAFGQPGMNPQAQNAAAAMIQQILTQPRPGGAPVAGQMPGAIGGGIAGFASNADEEGIMVYNDRTNYGEWEFVFDPAKMKPLFNPNSGSIGTPASQMGNTPGGPVGTPASQLGSFPGQTGPSPFGATPNPNPNPLGGTPIGRPPQ